MRSFIKKIIILLKRIFTIPSCIFSLLIGVCSASTFALFSNSKDAKLDYFASLMTQLSSYSNTEYGLIMDIEMGGDLGRLDVDAACHWCRNYSRYFFSNGAQVIRTIYDANLHPYVRVNDFFDSTPSLLISPIFSTHLNPNGVPTHDFYEVHFMFEELDMDFSGFDNFCCIRQSDADFLISKYPEKYSSYEDLIGEPLGLEFIRDGSRNPLSWKISNIILEEEGSYDHIFYDSFGSYILCYYYLPDLDGLVINCELGSSIQGSKQLITDLLNQYPLSENYYSLTNLSDETPSNIHQLFMDSLSQIVISPSIYAWWIVLVCLIYTVSIIVGIILSKKYAGDMTLSFISATLSYFIVYEILWAITHLNTTAVPLFSLTAIITTIVALIISNLFVTFTAIENPSAVKRIGRKI